ncbi:Presequence translocated-associated motor subunit PAM17 [Escovopsis weberi]|uniref:Presequence translocated-associated motor subunit PAM17 n=1 Tax=Escovopsis weberi TaxID=150374 RepID=A0A0N0RTR1_ESCWE|nr:Presequence translocated-associated motor subunit PAM17 [Escovopsis weberi]
MASPLKLCLRWPASCTTTTTTSTASLRSTCQRGAPTTALPPRRQMLPVRAALPPFSRAHHSPAILRTSTPSPLSRAPPRSSSSSSSSPSSASALLSSSGLRVASSRSYAAQAAPAAPAAQAPLTWDTFFTLRLRRRRIQLAFSVTAGLLGGAAGAVLLAEGFAEPLVAQIPLDPFVTLGLLTFACAGMGWLVGPTIGNQVFYLVNRRLKAQMMQKESEFFARVKKHRVDPSNSSAGNPVPDFYGEKIQSVAGYRRWLKDQRAFNKKKTASFV